MDELTLKGITQYYAFVQEKQKVGSTIFLKGEEAQWARSLFSAQVLLKVA